MNYDNNFRHPCYPIASLYHSKDYISLYFCVKVFSTCISFKKILFA